MTKTKLRAVRDGLMEIYDKKMIGSERYSTNAKVKILDAMDILAKMVNEE